LIVEKSQAAAFKNSAQAEIKSILEEYKNIEKNLKIEIEEISTSENVMNKEETSALLKAVYAAHNGVYRMSPDMEDLVETSNNIARVEVENGKIEIQCLTRSSVESNKQDLTNTLTSVFELAGFEVKTSGEYPGWKPNPDSEI